MVKKRVIPVILLREGRIVQSRRFTRYNILGDPTPAVERISNWSSDELIYLDITNRNDPYAKAHDVKSLIQAIALKCSVPLTFGGGVRSVEDVRQRLRLGADKITLNSLAIDEPSLIDKTATAFGSQCVVVSMDVKINAEGHHEVFKCGRHSTGLTPESFARMVEQRGAGEILVNSVDRDGNGQGFDIELIQRVCSAVHIPVIALGGAGEWEHFAELLTRTDASAVAAANIFHHSENSVHECKGYLYRAGFPVRKPPQLSTESSIL